jgi:TRAP-type transport system periplasmic protein
MTSFRTSAFAAFLATALASLAPASAQDVTLNFGHDQPPGSMYDEGHLALQRIVAEESGGAVAVSVFPAAQLGAEVAMIEGMRLGSVDGAVIHVANAATVVPELAFFSVAYLFQDRDHFERVVNDPAFIARIEQLVASHDVGLKVLGVYSAGVRNIYTRRGPATTPDELRGTKLRVMNNPVEAQVWTAIGAIPTPMNFGEVYQALQSGVLDAAENGLAVIEANKHFEPAPTIILSEHQRSVALLLMSEARFDALSPDAQAALAAAATEAAAYERQRDAELNAEAIERMQAKGAEIVEPDRALFAARVAPIQDEVAASLDMSDMLALIRSHAE